MKNKDRYDLRNITVKPKYKVNGCGLKIKDRFTFDVLNEGQIVAKDVQARNSLLEYLLKWMEEEDAVKD